MRNIENVVRAIAREGGLEPGTPSRKDSAPACGKMAGGQPELMAMPKPLSAVLARMIEQLSRPTMRVLDIVEHETSCRQLMTSPGIGAINALTCRATIDRPERFARSRDVGAQLGSTPGRDLSGETAIVGKISRGGDELARTGPVEAAHTLLVRSSKWSSPCVWGLAVAARRGMARAKIAVARKLGVILHRMGLDGTDFRFGKEALARDRRSRTTGSRSPGRGKRFVPAGTMGDAISSRTEILWRQTRRSQTDRDASLP